jgi:hypothetical protein
LTLLPPTTTTRLLVATGMSCVSLKTEKSNRQQGISVVYTLVHIPGIGW